MASLCVLSYSNMPMFAVLENGELGETLKLARRLSTLLSIRDGNGAVPSSTSLLRLHVTTPPTLGWSSLSRTTPVSKRGNCFVFSVTEDVHIYPVHHPFMDASSPWHIYVFKARLTKQKANPPKIVSADGYHVYAFHSRYPRPAETNPPRLNILPCAGIPSSSLSHVPHFSPRLSFPFCTNSPTAPANFPFAPSSSAAYHALRSTR